jgi:ubiquinone/menaquinone biosynthesis C-methylase UbiE
MRKLDRYEKAFAQHLLDMIGSDSHILDIPCGNGRFYGIFTRVRKLTMADYSENMLAAAREKTNNAKNVEFVRADISNLPLPDNCAELCFCMRLFHHMKTDEVRLRALSELARISKSYVALSFYNKSCLRYIMRRTLGKKIRGNYVTFAHIVDLAKRAGLAPVARFPRLNSIEQQCLVVFKKVHHK